MLTAEQIREQQEICRLASGPLMVPTLWPTEGQQFVANARNHYPAALDMAARYLELLAACREWNKYYVPDNTPGCTCCECCLSRIIKRIEAEPTDA